MRNFNEAEKKIERRVNELLDLKAKYLLTVDQNDQKFWRNRMLVHVDTWTKIIESSDPKYTLKYMPEKLVRNPLHYRFYRQSEHYSKYTTWMLDYLAYLREICEEPTEVIAERLKGP